MHNGNSADDVGVLGQTVQRIHSVRTESVPDRCGNDNAGCLGHDVVYEVVALLLQGRLVLNNEGVVRVRHLLQQCSPPGPALLPGGERQTHGNCTSVLNAGDNEQGESVLLGKLREAKVLFLHVLRGNGFHRAKILLLVLRLASNELRQLRAVTDRMIVNVISPSAAPEPLVCLGRSPCDAVQRCRLEQGEIVAHYHYLKRLISRSTQHCIVQCSLL
mmetsp:Transcript_765/g.2758  ORF Transcript_765/g.2758 Transcript_765/m.2758 type:complete len:217 (-) Transcript_765:624-1274(-)